MIPEGAVLSTVNQFKTNQHIQHEVERDTLAKRNEKLEEEIVKVRNVLKQAEEEIRRQDQAIQVKLPDIVFRVVLQPSSLFNLERHSNIDSTCLMDLSLMSFESMIALNIFYVF